MGANRHLGIGRESVYGTPVAPKFVLEARLESLKLIPFFEDTAVMRQCEQNDSVLTSKIVRGTIEAYLNYQMLPTFLYWITGSVSTTGAGPFVHTSPAAAGSLSTRPSLTVEIQRDGSGFTWKYAGCILTELSISVAQNQRALVTLGLVGASETTGSPTDVSALALTQDHVLPKHVLVKDVSTEIPADSFSLSIERPVDETIRLGDEAFTAAPKDEGEYRVSGEFIARPADLTVYDKFAAGTLVDMAVDLTKAGGDPETITLNMNKARIQQMTPEVSGRDPMTFPVSFKAVHDTNATSSLQSVSTNDQSAVAVLG